MTKKLKSNHKLVKYAEKQGYTNVEIDWYSSKYHERHIRGYYAKADQISGYLKLGHDFEDCKKTFDYYRKLIPRIPFKNTDNENETT